MWSKRGGTRPCLFQTGRRGKNKLHSKKKKEGKRKRRVFKQFLPGRHYLLRTQGKEWSPSPRERGGSTPLYRKKKKKVRCSTTFLEWTGNRHHPMKKKGKKKELLFTSLKRGKKREGKSVWKPGGGEGCCRKEREGK